MQFLYPSDPLNKRIVDSSYREESDYASSLGLNCVHFSLICLKGYPPYTEPDHHPIYLTPEFAAQLAEALEEETPARVGKPVSLQTYTS